MATYVNDLRLKEIATGDESGTWGASTNTNLELIAEAFSFGTEAITTNADTHTTTIADGSTDPGRSIFLKYTGTLDSACTITIGPNTVSKLWLIENATSGSQNIIIKQGSGATVTIANGQTKAIYSDGAGSGGAMVDAFQDLSIPDLFIDDDLTFTSDSAVITFGADGDTTLTHTDGSGLTLNSTNKLMFNDASQFIQGSSATVLSLGATDEIDLTATAIDVNGTIDVSGNATLGGTLGVTGAVTANAGVSIDNITIDGTEIDLSSGDLTIDVAGDIHIDAAGGQINFKDSGTTRVTFELDATPEVSFTGGNLAFNNLTADADIAFKGFDASSFITALTLDMSNAGAALFNGAVTTGDTITVNSGSLNLASDGGTLFIGADIDMRLTHDGSNGTFRCDTGDMTFDVAGGITLDADSGQIVFKDGGTQFGNFLMDNSGDLSLHVETQDKDFKITGNDGGSAITALLLDMSQAGRATFNEGIVAKTSTAGGFGLTLNTASGDNMALSVTDTGSGGAADGKISVSDGDLDFDVSGNIKLDADDAGEIRILDGGTQYAQIKKDGNNALFQSIVADGDFLIQGIDGSSFVTAASFDMSEGGAATFRGNMTMNGIAGTSPILNLVNNDTEDVNTGRESSVRFNGFRSGGEAVVNSQISGNHTSSADDDKGGLFFYTNGGSGLGERMRITSNEIIVNEDGGDQDFRIESQASTLGISLDASTGHVSMGVTNATTTYGGTFRLLQIGNGAGYGIFNGLTSATANDAGVASFFGQTSGTSGYDVVGGMRIALAADSSSNSEGKIEFYTATGGTLVEAMEITNSQQLILHGVKDDTTSDAANMNIRSSDGLVRRSTSSRRYKNTITDATHGLTELLKLRSVTYKGNNDGDRLFGGLIAEEVHDAGLTEFVQYNSDDEPDALAYGHMVSLCVKAIQEQQALIETLQAEVAALKGE